MSLEELAPTLRPKGLSSSGTKSQISSSEETDSNHILKIYFLRMVWVYIIVQMTCPPFKSVHTFLLSNATPSSCLSLTGASPAVQLVMRIIIRSPKDGILVPIPQYPLYSASIHLNGGDYVGYVLDEANGWAMKISELEKDLTQARAKGTIVRALAVINPGNPTGQCLSIENMKEVVRFCIRERLVLVADEVYQENIWKKDMEFHSFKKVVCMMGEEAEGLELFSFHSVSKGI
jgi:alanine transaminase